MEIGNLIKHRRTSLKLSLRALEKACGVSYVQLHKYETGKTKPSKEVLRKIAPSINLSSEYFDLIEEPGIISEELLKTRLINLSKIHIPAPDRFLLYNFINKIIPDQILV